MKRKPLLGVVLVLAVLLCLSCTPGTRANAETGEAIVYLTPTCGCCAKWVTHLEENGFETTVHIQKDLTPVKERHGVPTSLESCHTAIVDGYVIEGHVPADDVKRLLEEELQATGIAVPGMPIGSPGMEQGDRKDHYEVILFGNATQEVFAEHN